MLLQLLVVLVFTLDLLVDKSALGGWQIIDTFDLLLGRVVDVILYQVRGWHRIDTKGLIAIEGEKSQGEEVEQLTTASRSQVQIL